MTRCEMRIAGHHLRRRMPQETRHGAIRMTLHREIRRKRVAPVVPPSIRDASDSTGGQPHPFAEVRIVDRAALARIRIQPAARGSGQLSATNLPGASIEQSRLRMARFRLWQHHIPLPHMHQVTLEPKLLRPSESRQSSQFSRLTPLFPQSLIEFLPLNERVEPFTEISNWIEFKRDQTDCARGIRRASPRFKRCRRYFR